VSQPVPITPQTRVGELLDAYPQLEEVLIRQAPAFKALKNPILRRTVAKVATLEKAAQVGGIPVRDLVSALHQAAGLGEGGPGPDGETAPAPAVLGPQDPPPAWVREDQVRVTIDAEAMLTGGEVPLPRVQRALQDVEAGQLVKILSRFHPAPLIEAVERGGHRTCVVQAGPTMYHTYVCRSR
jgi:Domain of unknown function (DUF1858)